MGKSNRKASLESKIALLLGEHELKRVEIVKAEQLVAQLPTMRERLWEIETLIKACETIITSDHPDWNRDNIKAMIPHVHKIPVPFGASKMALDVLRTADRRMRVKEIAEEVLHRSGHEFPNTDTIEKVANTVGNSLRKNWKKAPGRYIDQDGAYPALWWAVKPT